MRFYQQQHPFYCGVDLHARSMHVCLVDQAGATLVHKNIEARPDRFLSLVRTYREGLAIATECMKPGTGRPICAGNSRSPSSSDMPST